jgi:hypothetical protein
MGRLRPDVLAAMSGDGSPGGLSSDGGVMAQAMMEGTPIITRPALRRKPGEKERAG